MRQDGIPGAIAKRPPWGLVTDRVEQPVPDESGSVPEQDDYRLAAELGLDLW